MTFWDLARVVFGVAVCGGATFVLFWVVGKATGVWDDEENLRGYGP